MRHRSLQDEDQALRALFRVKQSALLDPHSLEEVEAEGHQDPVENVEFDPVCLKPKGGLRGNAGAVGAGDLAWLLGTCEHLNHRTTALLWRARVRYQSGGSSSPPLRVQGVERMVHP